MSWCGCVEKRDAHLRGRRFCKGLYSNLFIFGTLLVTVISCSYTNLICGVILRNHAFHCLTYIGILLPIVTAISVNLTASPRLEEQQNNESIWLPVDCPPGHYHLEPGIERRYQTGGVYVCTQANWSGICVYDVLPLNQCFDLAMMWAGEVAAVGPDQGKFACTIYSGANLSGQSKEVVFPGYDNLTEIGWGQNTTNPVMGITCYPYERPKHV